MQDLDMNSRYVLIDDDTTYGEIMKKVAHQQGISLDVFPSLSSLGSIGILGKYDLAIVDYDLGDFTGLEIAQYLDSFFGQKPVLLVSGSDRDDGQEAWPDSIKSFAHKSSGYTSILDQAKNLLHQHKSAIQDIA